MSWDRTLTRGLEQAWREYDGAWYELKARLWGEYSTYSMVDPHGRFDWWVVQQEPALYVPLLLALAWAFGNLLLIFFPPNEDRDLTKMKLWSALGGLLATWGILERFWYGVPAVTLFVVGWGCVPLAALWCERCPRCRGRWLKIRVNVGDTRVSRYRSCPAEGCDYSDYSSSARTQTRKPGPYAAIQARALSRLSSSRSSSRSSSSGSSSGGSSSSSSSSGGGASSGGSSSFGGGTSGGGGAGRGF